MWRWITALAGLAAGAFLVTAGFIAGDGLTDDVAAADAAVVLGNRVEPNGLPSDRLGARLDAALEFYKRGLFKAIIVSGATGIEGFDEAKVMAAYLIERGVPGDAVIVDSAGENTMATARNTAVLATARGFHNVVVVTQFFHVTRSRVAMERYGVEVAGAVHADFFEPRDAYSLAREVLGLWVYMWPWQDMLPAYLLDEAG